MKLSVFFWYSYMGWSNLLHSRIKNYATVRYLKEGSRDNCSTRIPEKPKNVYKNYALNMAYANYK